MSERYLNLAEQLRQLWPAGNKTPNVPWRDSAKEIAKRLVNTLKENNMTNASDDDIIRVAKVYVNRDEFAEDKKYMRTLRYFISKVDKQGIKTSELITGLEVLHESEKYYTSEDNMIPDYGERLG